MWKSVFLSSLLLACSNSAAMAGGVEHPHASGAQARTVFSHALPQLEGSHLNVTTVEVTYPPGGFSSPHTHPCPVIGYVIRGSVRMQSKGGAEFTFRAGDSFYEAPNTIHLVSANASSTEPATFLAYFICDHAAELSVKVPEDKENKP
jgi:quercetin dioxygenase-like cupin family protein